jgi:hypothetical protein
VIPGSVESIGSNAFGDCTKLKRVTVQTGVNEIGSYAFSGCKALEEINLPDGDNGLKTIRASAFKNCSEIPSIHIPDSVMTLEGAVFGIYKASFNQLNIVVEEGKRTATVTGASLVSTITSNEVGIAATETNILDIGKTYTIVEIMRLNTAI